MYCYSLQQRRVSFATPLSDVNRSLLPVKPSNEMSNPQETEGPSKVCIVKPNTIIKVSALN